MMYTSLREFHEKERAAAQAKGRAEGRAEDGLFSEAIAFLNKIRKGGQCETGRLVALS